MSWEIPADSENVTAATRNKKVTAKQNTINTATQNILL